MRFQVMSDLHLEVGQQYSNFNVIPRAPRLILAGDIGRLLDYEMLCDFLRLLCQKFEDVYFVLGNHEFFGVSRQDGLRLADKLQREPGLNDKLVIMNRKRVDLRDITLLGCTLHSHVPPDSEEIVRSKVNDFRRIVDWDVSDHTAEHSEDRKWLTDEISSIRQLDGGSRSKRKIVVISHHAPLMKGTSNPAHENKPWSSAFATDLIGMEKQSCLDDVQWWVFGHTHYTAEFVCGNIKLISNQRGYVLPKKDSNESERGEGSITKTLEVWISGGRQRNAFDDAKVIEV